MGFPKQIDSTNIKSSKSSPALTRTNLTLTIFSAIFEHIFRIVIVPGSRLWKACGITRRSLYECDGGS